jgi:competence protein ComK
LQDRIFAEYIFYLKTLFIRPELYGNKEYSRVFEEDGDFLVSCKPLDIIKASCRYYCANYKGRLEGSFHVIGKKHKTPISLHPNLFIFPTTSPSGPNCIWVNDQHVVNHVKHTSDTTAVTFTNHQTYELPISDRSFKNQMLTASYLRNKFQQRIFEIENRNNQFYHPTTNIVEEKERYKKNNPPHQISLLYK